MSLCALAQEQYNTRFDSSVRDVYLQIIKKRGRPVRNIVVHSASTGVTGVTDRSGLFLFKNMLDIDTITVFLPVRGATIFPITGDMDSIVVTLRSSRLYSYTSKDGQIVFFERDNKTESNTLFDVPAMLKQSRYVSLIDMLRGHVAGLDINSSGGANIRGIGSVTGAIEPLVVLDGVVIGTLNEANNMININDIKTIEVLKSAPEWGMRGANGVIIITSK